MEQQPETSGCETPPNIKILHGSHPVYCSFCLNPQPSGVVELETVLLSSSERKLGKPKLLTGHQFLTIVHYLTGADPTFDNDLLKQEYAGSGLPILEGKGGLPPMCPSCYVALMELIGLHDVLVMLQWKIQDKVEKVRESVVERAKVKLDDRPPFMVKLHNQIEIAKVNKWIQFPTKPPPRDSGSKGEHAGEAKLKSKGKEEPKFVQISLLEPVVKVEVEESDKDDDLEDPLRMDSPTPPGSPQVKQEPEDPSSDENVVKVQMEPERDDGDEADDLKKASGPRTIRILRSRRLESIPIPSRPRSTRSRNRHRYQTHEHKIHCGFCQQGFPDIQSLNRHKWNDHQKPNESQKCDLCKNTIPVSQITKHLREVHGVADYMKKCVNPRCRKWFSCQVSMEHHARKQKDSCSRGYEWSWSCELESCDFETKRRINFKNHLQSHEDSMPEKPFKCPVDPQCSERFALKQSVAEHINRHDLSQDNIPKKQNCPICNLELKIGPEMEQHLKTEHDVQDPIKCKRCPFILPDKEQLLTHIMAKHWTTKRPGYAPFRGELTCDLCDEPGIKFKHSLTFRQHFFTVHQVGTELPQETVTCRICKLDFTGPSSIFSHMRFAHPEAAGPKKTKQIKPPVKCDICSEMFASNATLMTHKIQKHGAPPYSCKLCSETFTSNSAFLGHKRKHAGVEIKKTYSCKEPGCERKFSFPHMLHRHQRRVHPNTSGRLAPKKNSVCGNCGKEFGSEWRLQQHRQKAHPGVPLVCELCGESFKNSMTFKTHMLIHTEERPHTCHYCGQRFRTPGVMRIHLRGHEEKGANFKPNGAMKHIRKRVRRNY